MKYNFIEQNDKIKRVENFKSYDDKIRDKFNDINFCSNPIYRTFVFIVFYGILIYFIWFVSRKQYTDDIDINDIITTPFSEL